MRHRIAGDFFEPQLLGEIESRQGGHVEQLIDEVVLFANRHAQPLATLEQLDPGEGPEVAEAGDPLGRQHESARH